MPAPISSSFAACSTTVTRKPRSASAAAAVRPPMPAPAMMTVGGAAIGCPGQATAAFGNAHSGGRASCDTSLGSKRNKVEQ
jgi:hypothetical protein